MNNQDLLAGPIEFALQKVIKEYENPTNNAEKVIYEVLKRSEAVWNKIKIGGLNVYGLSYDEFCKQCEEKPNIMFLSNDEVDTLKMAIEIAKIVNSNRK